MILVPRENLLKHIGEPHQNTISGARNLGSAVERRVSDEWLNDAFTEAANIVSSCYDLDVEAFDVYVEKLRAEILIDQLDVIESVVREKATRQELRENHRVLLTAHILQDLMICFMNRESHHRLHFWDHVLVAYQDGFFPCGIVVPPTEKEWFDEELVEQCELLVF